MADASSETKPVMVATVEDVEFTYQIDQFGRIEVTQKSLRTGNFSKMPLDSEPSRGPAVGSEVHDGMMGWYCHHGTKHHFVLTRPRRFFGFNISRSISIPGTSWTFGIPEKTVFRLVIDCRTQGEAQSWKANGIQVFPAAAVPA